MISLSLLILSLPPRMSVARILLLVPLPVIILERFEKLNMRIVLEFGGGFEDAGRTSFGAANNEL